MLPNYITDRIITLYPTEEQTKTEAFINYVKCAGKSNFLIKELYDTTLDKVISAIAPTVIELINADSNNTVYSHECLGKYRQRNGDYINYVIKDEYVEDAFYTELKSGGKCYDEHLMLYVEVYFLTPSLKSIFIQEKSYNDELGFLYHQTANTMLIYFYQHDLFVYIENVLDLFDTYLKPSVLRDGFKDKRTGAWLVGEDILTSYIDEVNDKLSTKRSQYYDYYLVDDYNRTGDVRIKTLCIRVYLDVVMNWFLSDTKVKLFKINH